MKEKKFLLFIICLSILEYGTLTAKENVTTGKSAATNSNKSIAAACDPASSSVELNINNVRARIHNGGDMWWDLVSAAKYEVPKVEPGSGEPSIHALFASALWISGIDAGGQLKVAGQTYRQSGNDFWPGPLDQNGAIEKEDCAFWDLHFIITRSEVDSFINSGALTKTIINWPAKGNTITLNGTTKTIDKDLAPFEDVDQDGIYDPTKGDYPRFDVKGELDCSKDKVLFGDQSIWWVLNDKGNIHSESGGEPIGLEIHSQAFAFATSDEVNNMTFYEHTIYNKATITLNETYIGQWVDSDLGDYTDDYVGCDVPRGLGICYNGDNYDAPPSGYGFNPPSVGVDFFQGPLADANDGIDNDRDGVTDETGEQIIMAKFVYYNNDFSVTGNPTTATHYRNYLIGKWKDGSCITWGGTGKDGTECVNFMFPAGTDPGHVGQVWCEKLEGNTPADRRFLQSAGPFTLKPGAVNKITIGVVWSRPSTTPDQCNLEQAILLADDKAQALFNNCFKILNGPDAPSISIVEMDKELTLTLENFESSNNYKEAYAERDPIIGLDTTGKPYPDSIYLFQGYQVYQVKDATVSATELNDIEKAILIFQCDKVDNIKNIVNFYFNPDLGADLPVLEVTGANVGIKHTIKITSDKFALGDDKLVNFKKYHFLAVAYGHNNYLTYKPDASGGLGQKKRYIRSRRNIKVTTGIPHKTSPQNGGSGINSNNGDCMKITRVKGIGNGGNFIDITDNAAQQVLLNNYYPTLEYVGDSAPVQIKIYNPLKIPSADFTLIITGKTGKDTVFKNDSTSWMLINTTTSETLFSDTTINTQYEQLAKKYDSKGILQFDWGFLISVNQVLNPGIAKDEQNGFIGASVTLGDVLKPWLSFVPEIDGPIPFVNWIRAGISTDREFLDVGCKNCQKDDGCDPPVVEYTDAIDPQQAFEKILSGSWAPYRLCSWEILKISTTAPTTNQSPSFGPAWNDPLIKYDNTNPTRGNPKVYVKGTNLGDLSSIDLVITSDKSKWTRSVVVETGEDAVLSEGNQGKMDMRYGYSVNQDGNIDTSDANKARGLGWFPGYAINVETGERLNIMYGEDSFFEGDNGKDMKWNPTSKLLDAVNPFGANPPGGGKHWIYVMNSRYDECSAYHTIFKDGGTYKPAANSKRLVYMDAMWVTMLYLTEDYSLLATDVKFKIRANKPYKGTLPDSTDQQVYTFSTKCLAAITSNIDSAKLAMDLIGIVPNPYYAYSGYETGQLDNRVKFINLPDVCTISIYTLNGTLIRQFKKSDNTATYLDWDLKNKKGVPIASGIYVIYFDVPKVGQKILKWFGVMRPIDLDTF